MRPDVKSSLRREIWTKMEDEDVTLFPGAEGRIPNFKGRKQAANKLFKQSDYQMAERIKINPDSPQTPVRQRAFADGKTLYMAVPKLKNQKCFLELNPDTCEAEPDEISSIKGANRHGKPIHPDDMDPVDLIITGSVGVDEDGRRLGKGGGYSDIEFSVLLEFGLIESDVPIWSTVHPIQHLAPNRIPRNSNDITFTGFTRPDQVHRVESTLPRPDGIEDDRLDESDYKDIPILNDIPNSTR